MLFALQQAAADGAAWSVGLAAEPTAVLVLIRLAAAIAGVALLVAGGRRPRILIAALAVLVGLAALLPSLGRVSYGLTLLGVVLAAAAVLALYALLPRVVLGLLLAWPLPALYGLRLYESGSFDRSGLLALGLAGIGVAAGWLAPRLAPALLASALGTTLLLAAAPESPRSTTAVLLFVAGTAIQLLWIRRRRLAEAAKEPSLAAGATSLAAPRARDGRRGRLVDGLRSVPLVAAGVLGLAWLVALTAPAIDEDRYPQSTRLASLAAEALERPSLLIGAEDSYYLSGRAWPLAVAGREVGLGDRLLFPLLGRSVGPRLHRRRAIKEEGELETMRRAAAITSQAFADIEGLIAPGVSESEIEEEIHAAFRRCGATGLAFECIVGSGPRATLPHYDSNDRQMRDGLVVIDIGCSVDGYASDMTRTFAVDGRIDGPRRELFETIIAASEAARATLRAGVTMRQVDEAAREVIRQAGFGEFFKHGIGHGVGLNVHDPTPGPLAAGMVVTIEPGIYIPAGSDVDPSYWDLGIRIEDSYLVTEDGWEQLTHYPWWPSGAPAAGE